LALLLIAGAVVALEAERNEAARPGAAGVCFALLAVWCGLSLLRAAVPHYGLLALSILLGAVLLGTVVCRLASDGECVSAMLGAYLGASALVAAIGIWQYGENALRGNLLWRVFSTFAAPNFLAGFLVMAVPPAAAAFLGSASRRSAVAAGAALLLQVACLLLTGSRFGLLALLAALAFFAWAAVRSGGLAGAGRRRLLVLGAVCALAAAVGVRPLLSRALSAGAESHSSRFRVYTWSGTLGMAAASPFLGHGMGQFDTAYPRYAVVGYTQHAHNSYLQLAAEAGFPAPLLLLAGAGLLLAQGFRSLRCPGQDAPPREAPPGVPVRDGIGRGGAPRPAASEAVPGRPSPSVHRGLLVAGLLAGVAGGLVRSFFDSDLYVPAIAAAFATQCGLLAGLSRGAGGTEAREGKPPFGSPARWGGPAVSLLLALFAATLIFGRTRSYAGKAAQMHGELEAAIALGRAAAAAEPVNPDYWLDLAGLHARAGNPEEALGAFQRAESVSPTARVFRQFGRFRERQGSLPEAIRLYEAARRTEPNNLQTLLALAEACQKAGRLAEARGIYEHMAALYRSPYGAVRAIPELVEWEYGAALANLGAMDLAEGQVDSAIGRLREGAGILAEFWRQRGLEIAVIRVPREVMRDAAFRAQQALAALAGALEKAGRRDESLEVRRRLDTLRNELSAETG